ncbi:hypothetical protein ACIRJM_19250 [Streptomyces sp. NPDC102405]|uniref:hypothetical protein n=1 Tax=Streptomyces sp. NPDC102405 TaxID=3366170 RepID=UPI0038189D35
MHETEADRDDARTAAYLRLLAGRTPLPAVGTAAGIILGSGLELLSTATSSWRPQPHGFPVRSCAKV